WRDGGARHPARSSDVVPPPCPSHPGRACEVMNQPIWLRTAAHASAGTVLAFLMLPILAVIPASLSDSSFIRLPPESLSLRWYGVFLGDHEWRTALLNSVVVAVVATVLTVAVGTGAALGLSRFSNRLRWPLTGLFLAPMIVPVIVTAIAI